MSKDKKEFCGTCKRKEMLEEKLNTKCDLCEKVITVSSSQKLTSEPKLILCEDCFKDDAEYLKELQQSAIPDEAESEPKPEPEPKKEVKFVPVLLAVPEHLYGTPNQKLFQVLDAILPKDKFDVHDSGDYAHVSKINDLPRFGSGKSPKGKLLCAVGPYGFFQRYLGEDIISRIGHLKSNQFTRNLSSDEAQKLLDIITRPDFEKNFDTWCSKAIESLEIFY